MATNSTLSPEYLAESKTHMVTTMYAIPIALEAVSTGWRLWAAAKSQGWFAFDDYLMLFATVCSYYHNAEERRSFGVECFEATRTLTEFKADCDGRVCDGIGIWYVRDDSITWCKRFTGGDRADLLLRTPVWTRTPY
jgi:hypothetical protein